MPRDANNKITKWVQGMRPCDCGGNHLYTDPACPLLLTPPDPAIVAFAAKNRAKRVAEREALKGRTHRANAVTAIDGDYDSDECAVACAVTYPPHTECDDAELERQLKAFFCGTPNSDASRPTHAANVAESRPKPVPEVPRVILTSELPASVPTHSHSPAPGSIADITILSQSSVERVGSGALGSYYAITVDSNPRLVYGNWPDVLPLTRGPTSGGRTPFQPFDSEEEALDHMIGQGFLLPDYKLQHSHAADDRFTELAAAAWEAKVRAAEAVAPPIRAPRGEPPRGQAKHLELLAILLGVSAILFALIVAAVLLAPHVASLPPRGIDHHGGALDGRLGVDLPPPSPPSHDVHLAISAPPSMQRCAATLQAAYSCCRMALDHALQLGHVIRALPGDTVASISLALASIIFYLLGPLLTTKLLATSLGTKFYKRSVASLDRLNGMRATTLVAIILAISAFFVGAPRHTSSPPSAASVTTTGLSAAKINVVTLPYLGPWSPPASAGSLHHPGEPHDTFDSLHRPDHVANVTSTTVSRVRRKLFTGAPVIEASPDSACTATLTPDCNLLTNKRACDELFGSANGFVTRCTLIGDMPVYARAVDAHGVESVVSFSFTNVRCVPAFKYTLLSVDQLWEEQRIKARFDEDRHVMDLGDGRDGSVTNRMLIGGGGCQLESEGAEAGQAEQVEEGLGGAPSRGRRGALWGRRGRRNVSATT